MWQFLIIKFLLFSASTPWAQDPESPAPKMSIEELYHSGLQFYQNQDFNAAQESFQMAWTLDPVNKYILYNWGLSAYQVEKRGLALGTWRKALFLDPGFSPARHALRFAEQELNLSYFLRNASWTERFRYQYLNYISINWLLLLSVLLLTATGWWGLGYWGQRKNALTHDLPLPKFPTLTLMSGLLLLASLSLTTWKAIDILQPRATVITANTSVYSSPHQEAPRLFQLNEGVEVILRQNTNNWTQITYPGGLSGWVQTGQLFQTSGREYLW